MKKLYNIFVIVTLITMVSLFTCKKDDNTDNQVQTDDEAVMVGTDALTAQSVAITATGLVLGNISDVLKSEVKGSCPTISSTPATGFPKTHTLDFGATGCSFGGSTLYGQIIALANAKITQSNTQVTVTFNNFKVDTLQVSGTINIKVNSYELASSSLDLTATLTNLSVTTPSGTVTISSTFNMVWKLNKTLANFEDDVIEIKTGSTATGTDRKNRSFTANVTSAITFKMQCIEPVKGILEIIPSTKTLGNITVDCGNGECDGSVTVKTILGTSVKKI